MPEYSDNEMMAISAGRFVKDGDIIFAGTGLSILAATAAKKIYAPKAVIFFETGGIDPALDEIPMAVSDLRVMNGTCLNSGLIEAFSIVGHRKLRTIAFLGSAQIDKYGNLNTTVIGDYHNPIKRFSGSGGASDVASMASAFVVFMHHDKTRFVEKLDYMTSIGWYKGDDSRKRLGLQRGGALAVVTNLCIMKFDEKTKQMYLAEYFPGISIDSIVENTGFDIDTTRASEAIKPSREELRILREEVDPQNLIL
jgi:glutaconate CoA-transferase, subunit B